MVGSEGSQRGGYLVDLVGLGVDQGDNVDFGGGHGGAVVVLVGMLMGMAVVGKLGNGG